MSSSPSARAKEGRGLGARSASWPTAVRGSVRGAVALLMVAATTLRLGSHYDVSALVNVKNPLNGRWYAFTAGSFVTRCCYLGVLPQLLVLAVYTVVVGMMGALVAPLLLSRGEGPRIPVGRHRRRDGSRPPRALTAQPTRVTHAAGGGADAGAAARGC